jgi:hypothetical protein
MEALMMRLIKSTRLSSTNLSRRSLLVAAAASAAAWPAHAEDSPVYDIAVRRDPECGCCHLWVEHLEATGQFRAAMADEADMPGYKGSLGVTSNLASCHTGVVDGLIFEGHVPAAEILRLLAERPEGVMGLAVPGMPLGSPGMETPDGRKQAYSVYAFKSDGSRSEFARYEG